MSGRGPSNHYNYKSMNKDNCIKICNKLLRGERSAVETYAKAIEKHAGETSAIPELTRLRGEHAAAVKTLEENVRSMGGTPDLESGAWGTFANTVQSTANLFGPESAISALAAGEKHGLNDYESALKDDDMMPECRTMVQTKLLPPIREHLTTLERLAKTA